MKRVSLSFPGAVLIALGTLVLLGGCKTSSRWKFLRHGPSGKITTKVIVRTEPSGAEVNVNGKYQGLSPIEIPIRYTYATKIYERKEYVPYPQFEQRDFRYYRGNEFTIGAYAVGYEPTTKKVELKGEESIEVTIELRKSRE
jgi:hypothetical protein